MSINKNILRGFVKLNEANNQIDLSSITEDQIDELIHQAIDEVKKANYDTKNSYREVFIDYRYTGEWAEHNTSSIESILDSKTPRDQMFETLYDLFQESETELNDETISEVREKLVEKLGISDYFEIDEVTELSTDTIDELIQEAVYENYPASVDVDEYAKRVNFRAYIIFNKGENTYFVSYEEDENGNNVVVGVNSGMEKLLTSQGLTVDSFIKYLNKDNSDQQDMFNGQGYKQGYSKFQNELFKELEKNFIDQPSDYSWGQLAFDVEISLDDAVKILEEDEFTLEQNETFDNECGFYNSHMDCQLLSTKIKPITFKKGELEIKIA